MFFIFILFFGAISGLAVSFWFYEQLDSLGKTGKTNLAITPFRAFLAVESRHKELLAQRSKGVTAN